MYTIQAQFVQLVLQVPGQVHQGAQMSDSLKVYLNFSIFC